ncbi:hypothetical protein, conserved [Plasmodium gonderi]|uniref:Parasite-infected erythrocyte surface protein n=1 Tax=Plasmodium gonderi TaxID=77519 RepID=A0A1Y1JHM2_PLAGO|nr:hypothetical protein, conserved [Plasmodium gonderi]GAW80717.1 hypothetical protein, conserved [Plasmodium gonderi]
MNIARRILFSIFAISTTIARCSHIKDKLFKSLKKNTKFIVLNEPILDLGFSEGLLHTVLFDLEIGDNLYTLDEHLLNLNNLNHVNIFQLLLDIYKQLEDKNNQGVENIRYIFLGTAFTRVHPLNLELLLRKFNKYIYNGSNYKNGSIDIEGILFEYNVELKKKKDAMEEMQVMYSRKEEEEHTNDKSKGITAKEHIQRMIQEEMNFFSSDENEISDKFVHPGDTYKGLFIGYRFNDEKSSLSGNNHNMNKDFFFFSLNSGIIMDIFLLRNLCNHIMMNSSINNFKLIRDNIFELSKYVFDYLDVKLTHFENTCLNDENHVHLLDNDGRTKYDAYKYHLVLHLFRDYYNMGNEGNNSKESKGSSSDEKAEPMVDPGDRPSDEEFAHLILSYFNLFYPISTCASYSVRSSSEAFVHYDKYHQISIENDVKLEKYIKETEEINFHSIDEYKMKLNRINKKYDTLLDENENNWTHKNLIIGVVTSEKTENRIGYIKNTYDNKKNNELIFNSYLANKKEGKLKNKNAEIEDNASSAKGHNKNGENILNHNFLKSAFENEEINVQVIYFSDKESKNYDMLHFEDNNDIDSQNGDRFCKKVRNIIYHLYEEYVQKNSPVKFFFISPDNTFVNVKNLIDVMNLTTNQCTHSRGYMYMKYVKYFDHLDENESEFVKNFNNRYLYLYKYIKTTLAKTINALKSYNYVPVYCKDAGAGKVSTGVLNNKHVPFYIGKRYTHNSLTKDEQNVYHYLAGAAGILLNDEAVKKLYFCKNKCVPCPMGSINNVDKMSNADKMTNVERRDTENLFNEDALGLWTKQLNILPINFEGFFPKEPRDYNPHYLNTIVPITFHKLNIDKTVDETKKLFFQHLVNYKKGSNKGIEEDTESCVDYLDRNYKNTIDQIFHFFFYANELHQANSDTDVLKATEYIYNKMSSSKKFKHLFNITSFFKADVEDMIYFQTRASKNDNMKKGNRKEKSYTNNYVHRKESLHHTHNHVGSDSTTGETSPPHDDPMDDLESGEVDDMEDDGDLFDDDDYDHEEYLHGIANHKINGSDRADITPGKKRDSTDAIELGDTDMDDDLDITTDGWDGNNSDLPTDGSDSNNSDLPTDGSDSNNSDLPTDGSDSNNSDLPTDESEL